jgi:hypothetical protein
VHFLPARSWLSDSFTSASHVSPLSWTAASLEVVTATTLAIVGVAVLKRRGGVASAIHPRQQRRVLREVAVHPLVLAMVLGNVAVLVASIAQR